MTNCFQADNIKTAIEIFKNHIAPEYEKNESTFDLESFHGRFHILRSLLLSNSIIEFYFSKGIAIDAQKVFYAVMFHDIAREDNGIDLWESQSATACFNFLVKNGFSRKYAFETGSLILKNQPFSIEGQILYDVDVLDYHRFFYLPQEQHFFDESRLIVCSVGDVSGILDNHFRDKMICLAGNLVVFSEGISVLTSTEKLVDIFSEFYKNNSQNPSK